jgi:hypothetical protein
MMAAFNQEELTMNKSISPAEGSAMRQRCVKDMTVRGFEGSTTGSRNGLAGMQLELAHLPPTFIADLESWWRSRPRAVQFWQRPEIEPEDTGCATIAA